VGISQTIDKDTTIINKYTEQFKVLVDATNYEKALALNDSTLSMTKQYSYLVKRQIWLDRAGIFTAQKKWNDAYEAYQYTDSLAAMKTREDSIFKVNLHFQQGLNLYNLSKYDAAIKKYELAILIGTIVLGEFDKIVANCYHNIGSSYNSLNNYESAIKYYEIALGLRKQIFGNNSASVAHCFHNISICKYYLGDFNAAIDPVNQELRAPFTVSFNAFDTSTLTDTEKNGDLVTLEYTESTAISQLIATTFININPFDVIRFTGSIVLEPAFDQWVDTQYLPAVNKIVDVQIPDAADRTIQNITGSGNRVSITSSTTTIQTNVISQNTSSL
jgi:tetratricopeptide (TPR) repeat protein